MELTIDTAKLRERVIMTLEVRVLEDVFFDPILCSLFILLFSMMGLTLVVPKQSWHSVHAPLYFFGSKPFELTLQCTLFRTNPCS